MEHCEQKRRTFHLSAPRWLVSPPAGSMLPGSPLAASRSEPVARNGFSLARNSCRLSATSIPGSKLSACYFASFQIASVPVRPFGSTTAFRIAPVAAASLPGARCTSTTWFGQPRPQSPLPSGIFASLGIKAFNRVCCLPVRLTNPPDFPSLPAALSFYKYELRITVLGPLRFRRLAVPQTSWNLIHYAPTHALRQRFFGVKRFVFLSIYLTYFQLIRGIGPRISCG